MATVPFNSETSPSVVLELLHKLKVKDAMTKSLFTAGPKSGLREIQSLMRDHAVTGIPIVDGDRLHGIVSIGDIINAFDTGTMGEVAGDVMSRTLVTLDDEMPLSFAVTYFDRYEFGRFPVLDVNGRLCGIITASDILRRLLIALNDEISELEKRVSMKTSAPEGPIPVLEMNFGTVPLDFSRAGDASTRFKKALVEKGCPPLIARRVAVASYELELNQVIHSKGGTMRLRVFDDKIEVSAEDSGPGIPDVDLAMREGYSTANEWVRSLGFGAGMGLPNVKRVSDEFSIRSEMGKGTYVQALIVWDARAGKKE